MSRQLLILRHGKSDWSNDVSDFERPLKKRGKRAAQDMGFWLRQHNYVPDYIISSPAERARNTAERLSKVAGLKSQQVHYDSRLYGAEVSELKAVLADCPESAKRVLLVGHNPDLEELLEYLHKGRLQRPRDRKLLPTATLAILTMPDNWYMLTKGCAKLLSITRPVTVAENFPNNGLNKL